MRQPHDMYYFSFYPGPSEVFFLEVGVGGGGVVNRGYSADPTVNESSNILHNTSNSLSIKYSVNIWVKLSYS